MTVSHAEPGSSFRNYQASSLVASTVHWTPVYNTVDVEGTWYDPSLTPGVTSVIEYRTSGCQLLRRSTRPLPYTMADSRAGRAVREQTRRYTTLTVQIATTDKKGIERSPTLRFHSQMHQLESQWPIIGGGAPGQR